VPDASAPRALVTGGSGYFGSLLLRELRTRGWACRVFDLVDTPDRPADVEFFSGDVRDPDAVRAACVDTEVVFHNVAQVPLARDRALFVSVNVRGTEVLLDAARAAGVRKVVHTSSSAVFGVPKTNPVTEDTPPKPAEAYGRAKYEAERRCLAATAAGLDVTIIRPRTILGHGRLGIFQILFEWVRDGANIPVFGRGDNRYQFVHASDLAAACIAAATRPGPSIYNIGTDRFGTMRETLDALCAHAETGSRVRSVPMRPAVWAMRLTAALGLTPFAAYHALMYGRSLYFDISRASRELAWRPRHSNVEMFIESYEWYLAHREEVLRTTTGSLHRSAVRQGVLALLKRVL
jgi:nucleoside-diphosphate-sugar epimerase